MRTKESDCEFHRAGADDDRDCYLLLQQQLLSEMIHLPFHIVLNSSTYSGLSYIENQQFDDVISSNNLVWSWDNPNGSLDSTAFGDYRLLSGFFVIDRGFDFQGSQRGFKKLKIDSVNSQFYTITYSNLDNSELNTFQINKDNLKDFFSLFGQVSTRMTEFISIKLSIDKVKAKEIQATKDMMYSIPSTWAWYRFSEVAFFPSMTGG